MKKIVIPMLTLLFSASIFAAEIRVTIAEYSSKTGPYFDAAKKLLYLEQNQIISKEFQSMGDFHYWASFVYYNLGNYESAFSHIEKISDKDSNPEILFLEALILKDSGNKEDSNIILNYVMQKFPNNDYASYAQDILNDE